MKRFTIVFALLTGLILPAFANMEYQDSTVVITPDRFNRPAADSAGFVSVITSDEILQANALTLSDVFQLVPQISANNAGGLFTCYMNGLQGRYIKILLDGVDTKDPSAPNNQINFNAISVKNIDRVEIVNGANSALWGSDAIGGVINIVTKKGGNSVTRALVGPNFNQFNVGYTVLSGLHEFSFGYQNMYDNTKSLAHGTSELDPMSLTNWSVSGKIRDFGGELMVTWQKNKLVQDLDDANTEILNYSSDQNQTSSQIELKFPEISKLQTMLSYGLTQTERTVKGDPWGAPEYGYEGQVNALTFQGHYSPWQNTDIVGGYSQEWQWMTADGTEKSRSSEALFGSVNLNTPLLNVASSGRMSYYSPNRILTGNLAASHTFSEQQVTVKANISKGYREPDMSALYGKWGANPNLLPETAWTWNLGYEQQLAKCILQAGFFQSAIQNRIDYVNNQYVNNNGKTTSDGWTFEAKVYDLVPIMKLAGLSFETQKAVWDNKTAKRIPQYKLSAQAQFALGSWDWGFNIMKVGQREDVGFNPDYTSFEVALPSYVVVDGRIRYQVSKGLAAELQIKNVGNTDYQEVYGYQTDKRQIRLGVTMDLDPQVVE